MHLLILYKISSLIKRAPDFPLKSRSVVDLAYKSYGGASSESPVIILHGLLGSKRNWESMSKKITASANKTVIAVDARNHGNSPHNSSHTYPELASDVSRLMEKLSVKEAIVIGHSMGGRTGMVLALTEPSKVAGLVVVDISPITTASVLKSFFPNLLEAMRSIDFKGAENVASARNAAKTKLQASDAIDVETAGFILMNLGVNRNKSIGWMCNIEALSRHFLDIASFPTEMSGKQFNGCTLFIGGDQSKYIPPGDIQGIRNYFPKAELKYVKGAGHNVHADNPDAFLTLVLQFISSLK